MRSRSSFNVRGGEGLELVVQGANQDDGLLHGGVGHRSDAVALAAHQTIIGQLGHSGLAQSGNLVTSLNRLASTWVLVSVRVVESLAWSTYSMTLFSMTQISWRVILSLGAKIPSPLPEVTPAATAFSTMGSLVSVKDWVEGVISLPVASSIRLTASSANCRRVIWS